MCFLRFFLRKIKFFQVHAHFVPGSQLTFKGKKVNSKKTHFLMNFQTFKLSPLEKDLKILYKSQNNSCSYSSEVIFPHYPNRQLAKKEKSIHPTVKAHITQNISYFFQFLYANMFEKLRAGRMGEKNRNKRKFQQSTESAP
jgi:hypothetical protein